MSKKMTLLALAAVSAAMFALPAAASAQEAHIDGITEFTGSGGLGTLAASGEPTITCEGPNHVNGKVEAGGTTGTLTLDFTECHINVIGFTVKCRTAGSPKDNTIASGGTFHVITYNNKPAVLVTPTTTTIVCGGFATVTVTGSVIGTITSPACGTASKTMTMSFSATGNTQNHIEYTGKTYDLTAQTSGGSALTAGLTQEVTLTSTTAGEITCT